MTAASIDFAVQVRPLRADDMPLVYKSWIGVAWNQHSSWAERVGLGIGKDDFCAGMHSRIDRLVARGLGLVANPITKGRVDEGTICGYLVGEQVAPILHMVYVRDGYRTKPRQPPWHVATNLLRAAFPAWPKQGIWYSQHTAAMRHLAAKWNATYNPFLVE